LDGTSSGDEFIVGGEFIIEFRISAAIS
jgi:hypothetical protein